MQTNKTLIVFLQYQVACGNMYELLTYDYVEQLPPEYHSTKGLGRKGPNWDNSVR